MTKQYDLVIFDWEGTLSDTLGQVLNCVAEEARRLGFGELDEEVARQSVELGLVHAIKKVFPALSLPQYDQLIEAVQHSLMSRHSDVYLIPGALAIVERLHKAGVTMAVATNKGSQSLQRAMHLTGLDKYIPYTRCAGQFPPKPSPDMVEDLLLELGVSAKSALMVGDSISDIEMANSIQMDAIGVNFYDKDPSSLLSAGAVNVFDDYTLLADYLQLSE
ncbi:HAD family hydrolase [Legionella sp. CNM-4043-24]|uniref:HAD family hydrolase n=1 Tax=Legionella sp. CNM-4043-24 TaxID=3421646 RepID=UPI00403ADDB9